VNFRNLDLARNAARALADKTPAPASPPGTPLLRHYHVISHSRFVSPPPNSTADSHAGEHARWFADEVQPHGSSLKAYLQGAFPAVRDSEDVVQESFLRLWNLRAAQPIRSAKAFLFTVARNIALDSVRRMRGSPISAVPDLAALSVMEEDADVCKAVSRSEEIALLADALETLPARCREIILLRKFEHLSQKEVAARLGISELTVQEQVYRGVRRLEKVLRKRGVIRPWHDE
jgi:RNA polymerase sigma factor (sigma-70 family)